MIRTLRVPLGAFAAPVFQPQKTMNTPTRPDLSRRDFVKLSAASAGAATLAGMATPRALGANSGSDRIRVGVIGSGGRGRQAAQNCLESSPGVEIVAMGDLFGWQVDTAVDAVTKFAEQKK